MSGGSHGYVHYRMEGGELVCQEHDLRALPEALARHLAESPDRLFNEAYRPTTEVERADVRRYGQDLQAALRDLLAVCDDLHRRAADLAEIAHVLDRADSGDDSSEDVWAAVLAWGRRHELDDLLATLYAASSRADVAPALDRALQCLDRWRTTEAEQVARLFDRLDPSRLCARAIGQTLLASTRLSGDRSAERRGFLARFLADQIVRGASEAVVARLREGLTMPGDAG